MKNIYLCLIILSILLTSPVFSGDKRYPNSIPPEPESQDKPEDLEASLFYWVSEYKTLSESKKKGDQRVRELIEKYNADLNFWKLEIEKFKTKLQNQESELKLHQEASDKNISELQDKLSAKEKEISDLQAKLSAEKQSFEAQNTKSQAEIANLQKQLQEAQKQLASEKAKADKATADLTAIQKQITDLQKAGSSEKAALEKCFADTNRLNEEINKLNLQIKQLEESLALEKNKEPVVVAKKEEKIVIDLQDTITFDSGSAELKPDAKLILDKLENALVDLSYSKIIIEGNTDIEPIKNKKYKNNWQLASERALSVLEYLLSSGKFDPEKFQIQSNGEYKPIEGDEDKSKCRRVDIILIP
jgi:chemotaxis protein MotB